MIRPIFNLKRFQKTYRSHKKDQQKQRRFRRVILKGSLPKKFKNPNNNHAGPQNLRPT